MPYTRNRSILNAVFVFIPLVAMFAISYYHSARSVVKPYQLFRDRYYRQNPLAESHIPRALEKSGHHVTLYKGEKVVIAGIGIVYRGYTERAIKLDLTILELDPEMVYAVNVSRELLKDGYLIGDRVYRLYTAKKNRLRLRIDNADAD